MIWPAFCSNRFPPIPAKSPVLSHHLDLAIPWASPIVRRRRASDTDAHRMLDEPPSSATRGRWRLSLRGHPWAASPRFTIHGRSCTFHRQYCVSYCNRSRRPFLRFSNGILFFFCIVLGGRGASLPPLTCFYFYPL